MNKQAKVAALKLALFLIGLVVGTLPFFLHFTGWMKWPLVLFGATVSALIWNSVAGNDSPQDGSRRGMSFCDDDVAGKYNDNSHWSDIGIGMGVGRDD
ncbi:hypothetical protein OL229_10405 [Neisseriaceae bacterium JH1-16]|nr:hypothetical protein [Neisseriaceae bacterium JH1-16]